MGGLMIVILVLLAFGAFGHWVARQKRRNEGEGLVLGLLFGPVGVLVEALLPTGDRRPPPQPRPIGEDRIDPADWPDQSSDHPHEEPRDSRNLRR